MPSAIMGSENLKAFGANLRLNYEDNILTMSHNLYHYQHFHRAPEEAVMVFCVV